MYLTFEYKFSSIKIDQFEYYLKTRDTLLNLVDVNNLETAVTE